MKKIVIFRLLVSLCFIIICVACNRAAKSGYIPPDENYNTAIVMYPRINKPWEDMHFYGVPPESFTQDMYYKNHINKLEITDTIFINRLTKSINSRNLKRDLNSFDTWFMVLLTNNNCSLADTLAVWHNVMWFNREIYIDSTVVGIITDEIIRQDKDFAMSVNDYYDNGKWYPYLGKELTTELLGNTDD